MSYQFAVENRNYEDLSSGRVLYNQYGFTAFPVRLASEIFQRGKFLLARKGKSGPYRIYDPCCGGGYLLTSLGFLHGKDLLSIAASDIDANAVALARKNLSLLGESGLKDRMEQIHKLYQMYGKDAHRAALESAERLSAIARSIPFACDEADITKAAGLRGHSFDLVVTDVPYGQMVGWKTDAGHPVHALLENLIACLDRQAVVAIVSTKDTVIRHERYARAGSFKLGKRKITFLELAE